MTEGGSRLAGYLLALAGAVAAAGGITSGKAALASCGPLELLCMQFAFGFLFAAAVTAWRGRGATLWRPTRVGREGALMLAANILLTIVAIYSLWRGVSLADPTASSLVSRLEGLVTVLLGVVLLRERFTRLEALGGLLAVAGAVLLHLKAPAGLSAGFPWLLTGAAFFGIMEVTTKLLSSRVRLSSFLLWRSGVLAVVFGTTLLARWAFGTPPRLDGHAVLFGASLGLCGPFLARVFYFSALRRLELFKVALINQTQPLWVALIASLTMLAVPPAAIVPGGLLLLAGCSLLAYRGGRRSPPPAS